jgi:hypothetical protein
MVMNILELVIYLPISEEVVLCNCFMEGEILVHTYTHTLSLTHTFTRTYTYTDFFLLSECTLYCSISLTDVLINRKIVHIRERNVCDILPTKTSPLVEKM